MKEFDLAKAKAGAPVCTRDGRPVRIICWDAKITYDRETYPIIALIEEEGKQYVMTYDNNGNIVAGTNDRPEDLVMVSVKREGWVHIYDEFGAPFIAYGQIYETEEQANAAPKAARFITVAKVEWEE